MSQAVPLPTVPPSKRIGWPLEHSEPLALISGILNLPPSEHNLDQYGPVLGAITRRLLAKAPHDRYQTLRGLEWDLAHFTEVSLKLGTRDNPLPLRELNHLFGRDSELEQLRDFTPQNDQGLMLLLTGEGGIGKSVSVSWQPFTGKPTTVFGGGTARYRPRDTQIRRGYRQVYRRCRYGSF